MVLKFIHVPVIYNICEYVYINIYYMLFIIIMLLYINMYLQSRCIMNES